MQPVQSWCLRSPNTRRSHRPRILFRCPPRQQESRPTTQKLCPGRTRNISATKPVAAATSTPNSRIPRGFARSAERATSVNSIITCRVTLIRHSGSNQRTSFLFAQCATTPSCKALPARRTSSTFTRTSTTSAETRGLSRVSSTLPEGQSSTRSCPSPAGRHFRDTGGVASRPVWVVAPLRGQSHDQNRRTSENVCKGPGGGRSGAHFGLPL